VDFAIYVQLTQSPRDELGYLRTEVDNEEALCHSERIQKSRRVGKTNRQFRPVPFTILPVFVV